MRKKQVLFLCTGNSCRSHLAEGLTNHFLGESWTAVSAGTEPTGYVHPLAIAVMGEFGIEMSHHYSKMADQFRETPFDLVITVCDSAADNCPLWLGAGRRVHIPFPDPAHAPGNEAEQTAVFRQVRDEIRAKILPYLVQFNAENG